MKWTEAMIRKELQRLDQMTGLRGNDLIVDFGNAKRTLGCLLPTKESPINSSFPESTLRMRAFPDTKRTMSSVTSMLTT